MDFITFGRFGGEEHWKRDKGLFLTRLKYLISELTKNEVSYEKENENEIEIANENEIEIARNLKQILLKKPESDVSFSLSVFMLQMGLSYKILTKKEKEEIKKMEFTFENWEKKSKELYNDYLKKTLNVCPKEIHFCFEYRLFTTKVLCFHGSVLTKDNFLQYVRDFFLLEKDKCYYEEYQDLKEFNKLRDRVIEIYPKLKEIYGPNRYYEKYVLYFIDQNTDYNYKNVANILDNYYNKKKINNINDEEKIKLKED